MDLRQCLADLRWWLIKRLNSLHAYHIYAVGCFVAATALAMLGHLGGVWFAAGIVIMAVCGQRRGEVKALMLATEALLVRNQQWQEEREKLLKLLLHSAVPQANSRDCAVCGFDIKHSIHVLPQDLPVTPWCPDPTATNAYAR